MTHAPPPPLQPPPEPPKRLVPAPPPPHTALPAAAPPALLPRLAARQQAMLAEMGLHLWWARPQASPAASSGAAAQPSPHPTTARPGAAPTGTSNSSSIGPSKLTHHRPSSSTASGARGGTHSANHPAWPEHPSTPYPNTNPALPERTPLTLGWAELEQHIRACQRCPLGALRQHAVPGTGDTHADWLLVGEAPGQEEDQQGLPFVGRAGQLLQRMLAAMGLERERAVYITNTLKCRPPQNRNPHADEIAHCTPYLLRQIELLQPRIVLALGRFAASALLQQGGCLSAEELAALPLGKLRGRVYTARFGSLSVPVVVTYHPAYLLRSPAEKARAWADLCLALEAHAALPPRPTAPAPPV